MASARKHHTTKEYWRRQTTKNEKEDREKGKEEEEKSIKEKDKIRNEKSLKNSRPRQELETDGQFHV
jgi:hypothetical protein